MGQGHGVEFIEGVNVANAELLGTRDLAALPGVAAVDGAQPGAVRPGSPGERVRSRRTAHADSRSVPDSCSSHSRPA